MSLCDYDLKCEYRSLLDNIVQDFYIPLLNEAVSYKRAVGFFSSTALAEVTKGIAGLIRNNGKIMIVASPYLSDEDREAIQEGYEKRETVIKNCLFRSLLEPIDEYEEERLNLLSNLIAMGILEIKIAFLEVDNAIGMYHEKMGIISDSGNNVVAFTGSMNESATAFLHNYESIDVFCSWSIDSERVLRKQAAFDALWNDYEPNVKTIIFPEIAEEIIKRYRKNSCIDLEIDNREFCGKTKNHLDTNYFITIPKNLILKEYQRNALEQWENQGYCGMYDMATGTGKTVTALAGLERLERKMHSIAVFVVCPYIHLVNQWEEEVIEWGVIPIVAHSQSDDKKWSKALMAKYKRFRSNGKSFMCITTNATFCDKKIQNIIQNILNYMNCVLVIDEVHNFGAPNLSRYLPPNVKYRLGLSATIERHMDIEGTKHIKDYFGEKCIEYPIHRAIKEGALVPYEYHPIVVILTEEELEEYQKISKQISMYIIKNSDEITISESGQQLLFKRSRLVAGAENKYEMLREKLSDYKDNKHILVYCGATRGVETYSGEKEKQIDRVEKIIGRDLKMCTHRFTAEEDMATRKLLKEGFADGEYQVLTAIKCLDEGVNIPNIQIAFLLASSRNPKEFIQRRGRVLRRAEGKTKAIIYDFITIPRDLNKVRFGDFENDRALIIGELARIYEFGKYSMNSREADELVEEIQRAYSINILSNDLMGLMEEEYGED